MNDLGGYIASNVADATISFAARNISTQTKADLQRDANDLPVLHLNLDFDRAWVTVSEAMTEAKLDVTDVNREAGVFYVTVTDQMLESGRQAIGLHALVPRRKQAEDPGPHATAGAGLQPPGV